MGTTSSVLALATILFSSIAFAAIETTELEGKHSGVKYHRLDRPTSVRVENPSGNVTVAESSSDEIEIIGFNRGPEPVMLHLENDGTRVRIWLEFPRMKSHSGGGIFNRIFGRGNVVITGSSRVIINGVEVASGGGSVDLTIHLPKRLLADLEADLTMGDIEWTGYFAENEEASSRRIDLKTSHGHILCRKLCGLGQLSLRSSMGNVSLAGALGPLDVETSHGDVLVERSLGDMTLASSMGDVTVKDSLGDVYAETSHGNVTITGHEQGRVEGKSSMGDIYFDNPGAITELAKSSMGDVRKTSGLGRKVHPGSPLESRCVADLIRRVEAL